MTSTDALPSSTPSTRTSTGTSGPSAGAPGFIAYEYCTLRVDRDLESLYTDAYRAFGWRLEGYGPALPGTGPVSLKLKRDRRIPNRATVLELQRRCEGALQQIAALQRSARAVPLSAAIGVGVVGSGFLAGSVFALEAGAIPLSIVLGVIGLVGWLAGYLTHGWVRSRRTARLAPRIDAQYDVVYETGEQAARLLV